MVAMSERGTAIPDDKTIKETIEAMRSNGINVIFVENGKEALERIKGIIPRGAEVMMGGSVTLEQIGFKEYLKSGDHGWKNLYEEIQKEGDDLKRQELRRRAVIAEYFSGGALTPSLGRASSSPATCLAQGSAPTLCCQEPHPRSRRSEDNGGPRRGHEAGKGALFSTD
jgi:hypothetical protein